MKEVFKKLQIVKDLGKPDSPKTLVIEGPVNCNRHCSYCKVFERWDRKTASTVKQTCEQVDWGIREGFKVLIYVGGESLARCPRKGEPIKYIGKHVSPCALTRVTYDKIIIQKDEPFRTKEGITFEEHAEKIVEHAHKKGMVVNVTTNGDFVDSQVIARLKKAGVDSLSFSAHSDSEKSLDSIISKARMAAKEKIVPIVSVVFTKDRVEAIPKIAETCAANGVLFATTIVQERGGGFSATPEESQIPTTEQQKVVFEKLKTMKKNGFVRTNLSYLNNAPNFPDNSWKCSPEADACVHIRATGNGEVGVCSETPLRFQANKIQLKDDQWRKTKRDFVDKCPGCLYGCNYESENQNLKGDLRTYLNMLLIKSGQANLVRLIGKASLGKKLSEIKLIPESREELIQKKHKKETSIYGRTKRGLEYMAGIGIDILALGVLVTYFTFKERNPKKGLDAFYLSKILPGL